MVIIPVYNNYRMNRTFDGENTYDVRATRRDLEKRHLQKAFTEQVFERAVSLYPDLLIACCQIRLVPIDRRRACTMLIGPPGTGKSFIAWLLAEGLDIGVVCQEATENFAISDAYEREVVVWEEAEVPFQFVQLYKTFMQGSGYTINRKGKQLVFQREWTPVVMTCNQEPWRRVGTEADRLAFCERCLRIDVNTPIVIWSYEEMYQFDRSYFCRLLEQRAVECLLKPRPQVTRLYLTDGGHIDVGNGLSITTIHRETSGERSRKKPSDSSRSGIRAWLSNNDKHDKLLGAESGNDMATC